MISHRSSGLPARPAPRPTPWRFAALALLALAALLLLSGCLAEEGSGPVDPSSLSFATDVSQILTDAGCYDCHNVSPLTTGTCLTGCHGGVNETGVAITTLTYSGMVGVTSLTATGSIVAAGDSANSTLWWVVNGDAQYTTATGAMLTQMGTSSLTTADKTTIQNWIDGGANP